MSDWEYTETTDDECIIAHSLRKRFYAEREEAISMLKNLPRDTTEDIRKIMKKDTTDCKMMVIGIRYLFPWLFNNPPGDCFEPIPPSKWPLEAKIYADRFFSWVRYGYFHPPTRTGTKG